MGIAGLVSKRFETVQRPKPPTTGDLLRGPGNANVELSPEVREGLAIQARLAARVEGEELAEWQARHDARAKQEAARDAVLLKKIAAR